MQEHARTRRMLMQALHRCTNSLKKADVCRWKWSCNACQITMHAVFANVCNEDVKRRALV